MPKCCGGGTCACVLAEGAGVTITGSGSSQDPFLITADAAFNVTDNTVFNLTLVGNGASIPWNLTVAFAATAKLDDLPDVNAPSPTNAQVLGWDTSTSKWTPRAPTTAASGSVQHDTSLTGDGSGGLPLTVQSETAKFVVTRSTGIGLSDPGIKSLVRRYATVAARDAETLRDVNSLAAVDTLPGRLFYWTGTVWTDVAASFGASNIGSQFLALSGGYDGVSRLTRMLKNLSTTTDGSGVFDVLTASDLTAFAGVVSVAFQPTAAVQPTVGWHAVMYPNGTKVSAVAFRADDGTPHASAPITGLVGAWLY